MTGPLTAADPGDVAEGLSKTRAAEDATIRGAVRTDLILSAEVMAISLATLPVAATLLNKALVLGLIGLFLTGAVYGAVALIVKADDMGLAMAQARRGGVLGPWYAARPRAGAGDARLPQADRHRRHRGDALGRRRGADPRDARPRLARSRRGRAPRGRTVEPFGGVAAWLVKTLLAAIVGLGFGLSSTG